MRNTTMLPWWVLTLALLGGGPVLMSLTGCAGRRSAALPPVAQVTTSPPVIPLVAPAAVAQDTVPPDPKLMRARTKSAKAKKFADIITRTTVTYAFQPEREYTLVCPEWGVLTVRLLPGETLQRVVAGNTVEWMIDDTETGLDEPVPLLAIRRAPYAPPTEAAFITNANIYRFLLLPGGPRGKQATRQITFYDPAAEERRRNGQREAEEQRKQKLLETRYPTLSFEHIRTYDVGGDAVVWRPVRVEGDHQHTLIELPAATGTEQPTLSVISDGIETRVNYRTIPGRNGAGPVMVVDQAFAEARLIGEGGIVRITRRGQ